MITNISRIVILIIFIFSMQNDKSMAFATEKGGHNSGTESKRPRCVTISCCMIEVLPFVSVGQQYFSFTACCCSRAGFVNLLFDNEEINRMENGTFVVKEDILSEETETPFLIKKGEYSFVDNNLIVPISEIK